MQTHRLLVERGEKLSMLQVRERESVLIILSFSEFSADGANFKFLQWMDFDLVLVCAFLEMKVLVRLVDTCTCIFWNKVLLKVMKHYSALRAHDLVGNVVQVHEVNGLNLHVQTELS